jgi:hypothetical protein
METHVGSEMGHIAKGKGDGRPEFSYFARTTAFEKGTEARSEYEAMELFRGLIDRPPAE